MEYTLNDLKDTGKFGQIFTGTLKEQSAIPSARDLGTGRTTLTESIARSFGIEGNITSPTFSLVNTCYGNIQSGHIDLYRLENEMETESLDIDELLYPEGTAIIEWASQAQSYMPRNLIEIYTEKTGNVPKKVRIDGNNKREKEIIEELNENFSN